MNQNQKDIGQSSACRDQLITNEETLNQSFEDLEQPETDVAVCEDTQQIILEQTNEPLDSGSFFVQPSGYHQDQKLQTKPQQKTEESQKQKPKGSTNPKCTKLQNKFNYCKRILAKINKCEINGKRIQDTLVEFEQDEKKYIQKIKIIYAHFIIGTERPRTSHYEHLKAFLLIPKYGQELVEWGNTKYEHRFTVPTAIQRLDLIEKNASSQGKCQNTMKILLLMLLCVLIVKMMQ